MYSILLVDDEKVELEMLAEYIRWQDMDIRVAGTAKNGREALQRMEELRPDIILTDVRMPIMDGLEFSRRAKQVNRSVQIVFLSGHDEFQYIKAALAVEAAGYLLKPLDLEELCQLMDKVKGKCQELKMSAQSSDVLKETYLRECILESDPNLRKQWLDKLFPLAASSFPSSGVYRMLYITVDRLHDEQTDTAGLVRLFVKNELSDGMFCQILERAFALLCSCRPGAAPQEADEFASRLIQHGKEHNVTLTIGVSGTGHSSDMLYRLYGEAKRANEHKFFAGLGTCLHDASTALSAAEPFNPDPLISPLCHSVAHLQETAALQQVHAFFDEMRKSAADRDLVFSNSLRLITAVMQHFVSLLGESSANSMYANEWRRITGCLTIDEIELHVKELIVSILAMMKEKDKDKNLHVVHQIIELINRDFGKPLTVDDISKTVFLSPNYVRTLFKEKTGGTILEYITRIRMEHATKLLKDRSKKIHEIAAMVGYENVSYFCNVFQKFKGSTPNEYRKIML